MIILTIRTDKPEAEIGLYNDHKQLAYKTWQAHRELAETIHKKIDELLSKSSFLINNIEGIVCYKGPGSFTGLRIGLTVANALAYANNVPVVARMDPKWLETGIDELLAGKSDKIAIPEYGAEAKTTTPKK